MHNHPPKDTLPLGNYRGSGQHSDDYTAATSQFHHEFLHIPPPEHKEHQKLISSNSSNLKAIIENSFMPNKEAFIPLQIMI